MFSELTITQIFAILGLLLALSGHICGVLGAHYLKPFFTADQMNIWETSVRYQLYNALGLLFVAGGTLYFKRPLIVFGGWSLLAGTLIFTGSLALYALSQARIWALITPIGGILLILSWIILVVGVFKSK